MIRRIRKEKNEYFDLKYERHLNKHGCPAFKTKILLHAKSCSYFFFWLNKSEERKKNVFRHALLSAVPRQI